MDKQKIQGAEETSLRQPFKVEWYTVVAVIFFITAALVVELVKSDVEPSFHKEIFPTDAISYIADGKPVALPDGEYQLAMPAGGTFVNGIPPMLMIKVGEEFFPLNIADDSILPRQGKMIPLRILFGFTSPHASNTLKYDEKRGGNPAEDFRRKAYYWLKVENGFGTVKRIYQFT